MHQSGWFYERARGQWENEKVAKTTNLQQKRFELRFPKNQRIVKTDWAKFEYCWASKPHLVSKGAQFVFLEFAKETDKEWTTSDSKFNDSYFRKGVAKGIIYNQLHSAVRRSEWYKQSPGYLANIIAYTIALFSLELKRKFPDQGYDLEKVWKNQSLSEISLAVLLNIAKLVQRHLTDDDRPQANVTQWAKQEECWKRLKKFELSGLPEQLQDDLSSIEDIAQEAREERSIRRIDNEVELMQQLMEVTPKDWRTIVRSRELSVSPTERGCIEKFGIPGFTNGLPSKRQAEVLQRVFNRALSIGVVFQK